MICKKNHIAIILTDIAIFGFNFTEKKHKNDDDMTFAGVCTKQARSLTCGECG